MSQDLKYVPPVKELAQRSQRVISLSKHMSKSFGKDESTWTNYVEVAIMAVMSDAMKEAYQLGVNSVIGK